MVFRRGSRPSWYFQARTRAGWKPLCAFTPDKRLGQKIEAMWEEIAIEHRAWDVLDRVLKGDLKPPELYDRWLEAGRSLEELRRRIRDTDLEPLVDEYLAQYAPDVAADSAKHVTAHLRWLLPKGQPRLASACTPEWLTARLAAYKGKRNTRRKVHSSWSGFFAYCVAPKRLLARNPMEDVERPPLERSPIRFYELRDVQRIVGWFPDPERRAYFALLYGSGMDVSDALPLLRSDLDAETHEIRAMGTKTHTRDRVALIADWAWPTVWAHAQALHPDTRLFPATWDRWDVGRWHRQAIGEGIKDTHGVVVTPGLKLPRPYPPKCARHHWAVRQLRAGAAVRVVSEQLGHATTQQTLDVYGRFMAKTEDRQRAEEAATRYDAARASKRTPVRQEAVKAHDASATGSANDGGAADADAAKTA